MNTIEALHLSVTSIGEHLADAVEKLSAISDAQESIVVTHDQIKDSLHQLASKVGQLYDLTRDVNMRLGSFITDQSKHSSSVRDVDKRLRELESKLETKVG